MPVAIPEKYDWVAAPSAHVKDVVVVVPLQRATYTGLCAGGEGGESEEPAEQPPTSRAAARRKQARMFLAR